MGNADSTAAIDETSIEKVRGVIVMQQLDTEPDRPLELVDGFEMTVECQDVFEDLTVPLTLPAMSIGGHSIDGYHRTEPPSVVEARVTTAAEPSKIGEMDKDEVSFLPDLPSLHPGFMAPEKRNRLVSQSTSETKVKTETDKNIAENDKILPREQRDLLSIVNYY